MYEYRCNVLKIVDGDTVDVDIDLGFGVWLKDERVRIMGIDTPESRTSDPIEKKFGLAAKDRLKQLLGKTAILKTQVDKSGEDMKGKFGRILGDFVVGESTVTQILISEGHAVAYFGGSKDDVQEQHKKNRERLIAEGIVTIS
jgi:micrococcal nuclease